MSRYRPIAPKPDTNSSSSSITDNNGSSNSNNNNSLSQKIRNSPYLRSLWPQLQARPTRTRKRGRAPILTLPPSSLFKRQKIINNNNNNIVLGFCPPTTTKNLISLQSLNFVPSHPHPHQHPHPHHHRLNNNNPLSNHAIGVLNCQLENTNNDVSTITTNSTTTSPSLVTLPLLPCSPSSSSSSIHQPPKFDLTNNNNNNNACKEVAFDLNLATKLNIPEEKDLLQQLQRPVAAAAAVVAPQPVRPVGSTISVGCINEDATKMAIQDQNNLKRKQEVEDEVESETLPAIITDSKNRVRMVNSSYKELVGQPECPWLESMVTSIHHQCGSSSSSSAASSTASSLPSPISTSTSSSPRSNKSRISGEVTLQVCDDSVKIPGSSSNGFSCWVRIEWQQKSNEDHHHQRKKICVSAFCDVTKLCCEYRDYVFSWRFHTRTREASQSSCNNNV
ncbi:hypothetical protein PIB30_021477 [Stylosanthes scabra]|uniref:Uncharacterized protein n=1 Tax=Stylosanthes scabra TaxID=79078 RepID=A0ABU6Y776_9FABA|nr:hypothetical protein [Stylosanthes scabra]